MKLAADGLRRLSEFAKPLGMGVIVKNHGGAITVDSLAGQGTTFSLFLPATEALSITPEDSVQLMITGTGWR